MDKEQTARAAKIMQACSKHGVITERRIIDAEPDRPWHTLKEPDWNWTVYDYRIKPAEPEYVWVSLKQDGPPFVCFHTPTEGMTRYRRDKE